MSEALKRLLAKKKAAEAAAAQTEQPAPVSAPAPEQTVEIVGQFEATEATEQEDGTTLIEAKTVEAQKEVVESSAGKSTHPLAMEMAQLEQALNNNVPDFANKLREIHIKLRNDPHIVTLLSDEEIGVIVGGLEKHTNIQIVSPKTKSASGRKALLSNLSASDL